MEVVRTVSERARLTIDVKGSALLQYDEGRLQELGMQPDDLQRFACRVAELCKPRSATLAGDIRAIFGSVSIELQSKNGLERWVYTQTREDPGPRLRKIQLYQGA